MNILSDRYHRFYSYYQRAYRFAVRKTLQKNNDWTSTSHRQDQLQQLLSHLSITSKPLICIVGSSHDDIPNLNADFVHADFDVSSEDNILDVINHHTIDGFYVIENDPSLLVNLINFMGSYQLDAPVLLDKRFACRSLISFVPVMPQNIVTTVNVHNYFGKNYRISDTLLLQGSLYEGTKLVDSHQFLLKPDESTVVDIRQKLDADDVNLGMYYLEVVHPQLPQSTSEFRYFGLYRDSESKFMAGSHSMPLGSWRQFGAEGSTRSRTFIPNRDGALSQYVISGQATDGYHKANTTLGRIIEFKPTKGKGGIESIIRFGDADTTTTELEFDRIASQMPTLGRYGFQTIWLESKGLALWHDGGAMGPIEKPKVNPTSAIARQFDEPQSSLASLTGSRLLYQTRIKYFIASCPHLGQDYPDLHIIFDHQQSSSDLRNFDLNLFTNEGHLVATRPFTFNRLLETVNMNKLFADEISEISQGYWTVTADQASQATESDNTDLQYPSNLMLFVFWGDDEKIYDSVNMVSTGNQVAYGKGTSGASELARATGRIMTRTKKFAPFVSQNDNYSWYWVANVGVSEEKIDAIVKFKLYESNGTETIFNIEIPAGHAAIISAEDILEKGKVDLNQGVVWLESNDCNLGAMWFMQESNGKGFAVDHFTGG